MSDPIIRIENLGKMYRLHHLRERQQYVALRDVIAASVRRLTINILDMAGRKDPHRGARPNTEEFWALKDISFEVQPGEAIGIIGRNGAGKSTLLKILSRITVPTEGRVHLRGRVASLLEVGTGFHPELTGRENIFLNGAILGMSGGETKRKFDGIVDFAEVSQFVDTPVKHYSSGMYMRLAFAVAAHLEPEILIVDEVLAVGDAQFQQKCLGKMKEVGGQGRTVLFVSHNIGAVLQLCKKCVYLKDGRLHAFTAAQEAVALYSEAGSGSASVDTKSFHGPLRHAVTFEKIIVNGDVVGDSVVSPGRQIRIRVTGRANESLTFFRTMLSLFRDGVRVVSLHDVENPALLPEGPFEAAFEIPAHFLRPGTYSVAVGGRRERTQDWVWGTELQCFSVLEEWGPMYDSANEGMVNLPGYGSRVYSAGST